MGDTTEGRGNCWAPEGSQWYAGVACIYMYRRWLNVNRYMLIRYIDSLEPHSYVLWLLCTCTCRCSCFKRGTMYWDCMQRMTGSRSESWRTGSGSSTFSPSHNQWMQRQPTSTRNPQPRWWYTSTADRSLPPPLSGHPVVQTGDQGDTKHHWKGQKMTMVCELVNGYSVSVSELHFYM